MIIIYTVLFILGLFEMSFVIRALFTKDKENIYLHACSLMFYDLILKILGWHWLISVFCCILMLLNSHSAFGKFWMFYMAPVKSGKIIYKYFRNI